VRAARGCGLLKKPKCTGACERTMSVEPEDKNLADLYASRASEAVEPPSSISIPRVREARDLVYSGSAQHAADQDIRLGGGGLLRKKQRTPRKISPFNVILILIGVAIASVLYISNILMIGRLLTQIDRLQAKHQQLQNEKEMLSAQINRLSNLDRIQELARDRLGMENPKQLPQWIQVDPERVDRVQDAVRRRLERNP
jgi:cell division protein FtsL